MLYEVITIEILAIAGDRLSAELRDGMARHLYHSGAHVVANLGYTLSSSRNNHLVGVITSYSIHYTKLYELLKVLNSII